MPSNQSNNEYAQVDSRSAARYGRRVNPAFSDSHAAVKNSFLSYTSPRTDEAALWARNHNEVVP